MDAEQTGQETEAVKLFWAKNEHEVNLDELKPQDHPELIQRGNYIICLCHNHQVGIDPDLVLNKRDGAYVLDPLVVQP